MKKLILSILLLGFQTIAFSQLRIFEPTVEYARSPKQLDIKNPRFSWKMENKNGEYGQKQIAYQIIVREENGGIVWDSGRKEDNSSLGIYYSGKELKPKTHYDWELVVWDNRGRKGEIKDYFETGLMGKGFGDAQWIGSNDLPFYAHYLSVYIIESTLKIEEFGKAAVVFGANDPRLSDSNLNLMGVENKKDESFIGVELDLNPLKVGEKAKLNIYRVGYSLEDSKEKPLVSFEIDPSIIDNSNKNEAHTLILASNFGVFEFYIDQKDAKHLINQPAKNASPYAARGFNLNPVGSGNNFISFPMVSEVGYWVKKGNKAEFEKMVIRNFRGPNNALFEDSKITKIEAKTGDLFQVKDPSKNSTPYLRTEFSLGNKEIKNAKLYATARGIYEFYLNGKKVDEDYFKPGLTQYNIHHEYQSFDVTNLVKAGKNTWGTILAEGWWSGNITYSGENWNFFGDRSSFIGNLEITYSDGTTEIIPTKPGNWKSFSDGPIIVGSFFQGEVYDARKEEKIEGWNTNGFDDSNWKEAQEITLNETAWDGLDYSNLEFRGQMDPGVHLLTTLKPIKIFQPRNHVYVYDMGQNMVGFPEIKIKNGKPGQKITLRYAEVLYPDLPEHKGMEGMIMLENIRAALVQDEYILKGGDEIIQPKFTFHGFRYLEITGIEEPISREDITGMVISSVDGISAGFESSNALVNKLWSNITWSLRGNFLSIPTDTPARNERMGWSGDINVFSKSANILANVNNFMRKHMMAMRDLQTKEGRFGDVAPVGGGFGGTLWGSAGIIVAWETYLQNGDIELLKEHYPAMKKYTEYLETKENGEGILNEGPLGDWLSPEVNSNDNTSFWMTYQAYNYSLLKKSAEKLGYLKDEEDFGKKYEQKVKEINEIYFNEEGKSIHSGVKTTRLGPPSSKGNPEDMTSKGYIIDTQASYAIPLNLGVVKEDLKEKVVDNLVATIQRENTDDLGRTVPSYSLMTGFIGTASINEALSKAGKDEIAYQLLVSKNYPSWLYPVINGATTIWERLNSYTIQDGFGGNNSMNSFNHYSFGAVAGWMYEYMLGIRRDEAQPGYKHFILNPRIDETGNIGYVQGNIQTMYGKIESKWYNSGSSVKYNFVVPANTTASLILEKKKGENITRRGKKLENSNGIEKIVERENEVIIEISSGEYQFEKK